MTTAQEVGTCPECGSTDKGTRYSLTPGIMDADERARFCKNAWHDVPPDAPDPLDFTPQEITVILALAVGMRHEDIEQHLGIAEHIVQQCRASISDKASVTGRPDLFEFVRAALNRELRHRRSHEPW